MRRDWLHKGSLVSNSYKARTVLQERYPTEDTALVNNVVLLALLARHMTVSTFRMVCYAFMSTFAYGVVGMALIAVGSS